MEDRLYLVRFALWLNYRTLLLLSHLAG